MLFPIKKVEILSLTIGWVLLLSWTAQAQKKEATGGRLNHRDHYFDLGRESLEKERYEDALGHFNRSIGYDAYHEDAYYLRATAKEHLGDDEGALTDYSIVLHIKPEHVEALFGRGILYYHMGRLQSSKDDFLQLLKTPLTETNAIYFRVSNYQSGVSGVMSMETNMSEVYNYLGLVCGKMDAYEEGIAHFKQAIELNGSDPNFYVNKGLLHEQFGHLDSARIDFESALTLDESNELAIYNLLRLSDDNQSIDLYTSLIENNPEFDEPYAQRGLAKYNLGEFRGALMDFNKAIEINDRDFENYLNRGLIKEKLRDVRGAYKDYDKAIQLNAGFAKAYLNRGNILTKQKYYQKAIEDYNKVIALDPKNTMAYYNRAVAKYSYRDRDGACDDVTRALELGMLSAADTAAKMCPQDQ